MEEQLAKFFAGEANDEEKKEVMNWREASPENAEEFLAAKTSWITSGPVIQPNETLLNEIIEQPEAKVVAWPSYLKYAAAVVLLAMFAALWYFNNQETAPEVYVFNGSHQVLEDGSIVSLKKGATLQVIEFSENLRKVKVTGKAFFEIERDEKRPFQVITDDAIVSVLGTSFQVAQTDGYTEVCVASGLVSLAKNNSLNKMSLNLSQGEMGLIKKENQGIIKRKIVDKNFLAWKNGVMNFEGIKTTQLAKVLGDVYDTNIYYDEAIMNCKLTAQFSQKTLEEVIQILSNTFNWTYQIELDKVVLSGNGC
jgi:ferric-dicitrate binding protein FerR (iron transport regulator)